MSRPAPADRSSIRNGILASCPRLRELSMILEIAILNVRPGREDDFEALFAQAYPIIASMPGYVSHQLQHCVETSDRYALLVDCMSLEAHTVRFRGSPECQRWRHP